MFVVEVALGADVASNPVLLLSVVVVALLVIARQGIAILDNRATIEEQRDLLVTTISHELRTPLTAVVGYVELLYGRPGIRLEGDQVDMLDIIHEQADYMSTIVSDLIMLARGTDGGLDLDVEQVAVEELASTAINASGIDGESVEVEGADDRAVFVDR